MQEAATQVTLSRDKAQSGQLDLSILQDSNHRILNFKPKKPGDFSYYSGHCTVRMRIRFLEFSLSCSFLTENLSLLWTQITLCLALLERRTVPAECLLLPRTLLPDTQVLPDSVSILPMKNPRHQRFQPGLGNETI